MRKEPKRQNDNHLKKIKSADFTAGITAILLLTSGCVVSPEDNTEDSEGLAEETQDTESGNPTDSESQSNNIIASSTTSSTPIGESFQIDVYALEKVGGDLLRLRIGVTNKSNSSYFLQDGLSDFDNPYTANRITLLDPINQARHLSLSQSNGSCFCSTVDENIPAGESADMWVVFPAPPSDVSSMTITTPLTPPIMDIPISESTETIENSGLSDPEIIPLTMISDNVENSTGRTENDDEISIILSSDVLFETNSANLSSEAQEILEQVASEIDDASSSVVNIDGHADNTGSDSVNVPLSQDRAESVEFVLTDLITRSGVTFEVEGHGSSDPIGDNETEEGRDRNRRVSVTFEK